MFCISGFRLFDDFLEIILEAASLQEPIPNDYFSPERKEKAIARIMDRENDIVFRQQVWCEYILQSYFVNKSTRIYACSQQGEIQEVSTKLICVPTRVCQKFDPHSSIVSFVEFAASSYDSYPLVDRETWTLDISKYIDRLNEKLSLNRSVGKARTGTQMCSEVEILMKISEAEKIQHLNGWSICIKDGQYIDNAVDLIRFVECGATRKASLGRPEKQTEALRAYESLYPNGHSGIYWQEVVNQIKNQFGLSVSIDTLRRALADKRE